MSPRNTFHSWGSSSSEVRRSQAPTRVTTQPPAEVERELAERREQLDALSPAMPVNRTPFSLGADLTGADQATVAVGLRRAVSTAVQNNLQVQSSRLQPAINREELQSVTFINGTTMKALGKPSWRLGIVALEAAGSIIGFVIAVRWGIVAVAAALAIANYALAPVSLFATNKLIGLEARRYVESLRAPLAASVAMAAAVAALKGPTADLNLVTQVVLLVATGIVTYLGLLLVFARPVATDFIEIAKLALPSRGKSAPIRTSAPETDPEEI